jgi:hypothetical protein
MSKYPGFINIVQIETALLVKLSAVFITNKLGVPPAKQEGRLILWNASDYPKICDALAAWSQSRRTANAESMPAERPKADKEPAAPTPTTAPAPNVTATPADPFAMFGAPPAPAAAPAVADPFAGFGS